ncbi:brachyurin-like [Condylostylus longicornis]|uniref:brachyurin-like n=1 Tax=Condylostylus longicornis TaxID=2530218 RepID=UPI00244DA0EF|nr:brachyurin-like [Condylostylus longicornis]
MNLIIIICGSSLEIYEYEYVPFLEEISIQATKMIESRITGGEEAIPHSHPFTVGLHILTDSGKTVWCGGALISIEWVLTAAHCVKKGREVMIYVGCHDRTKDCSRMKTSRSNIIKHESYSGRTLSNDIALIKLPEPVLLDEKVQTIDLPKHNRRVSYVGKWATVSGWGIFSDSVSALSRVLRVVQLPIIDRGTCQNRYTSVPIRETNICAASPSRRSTCAGDSGGPLVLNKDGFDKVLIGITSFGYKRGCEKGWPAVFTKVAPYVNWIKDKTGIY